MKKIKMWALVGKTGRIYTVVAGWLEIYGSKKEAQRRRNSLYEGHCIIKVTPIEVRYKI